MKRGVALNVPIIAASALYGVDAANVQIDDYQFATVWTATALAMSVRRLRSVVTSPPFPNVGSRSQPGAGPPIPCAPARCPRNRWADLVAGGLPWLLPS